MFKTLVSSFFAGVLSEFNTHYYMGASYELDYTGANVTQPSGYTVQLISSVGTFDVPGGEFIVPGQNSSHLDPILLYQKVDSLLIPDDDQGHIQITGPNDTIVFNETVTIRQSITLHQNFNKVVNQMGDTISLMNIKVYKPLWDAFMNATITVRTIDINDNGTWNTLTRLTNVDNDENKNNNNHGRRLLSNELHTQYFPYKQNNKKIVMSEDCSDPDWCIINQTVEIPANPVVGGPYFVNVMVSEPWDIEGNAFTVIGRESLVNGTAVSDTEQLVIYNAEHVNMKLKNQTIKTPMDEAVPYYYYETGDIDIDIGNLSDGSCVFITLSNTNGEEYIASCDAKNMTDFRVVGWKFHARNMMNDNNSLVIPNGTYMVNLYLDPDCENTISDDNKFELPTNETLYINLQELEEDINNTFTFNDYDAKMNIQAVIINGVNITNPESSFAGQTRQFEIETAYNYGTIIEYYFETCQPENATVTCAYVNTSNTSNTSMAFTEKYESFVYDMNSKVSVKIPTQLKLTSAPRNITNNIVFVINDCDNNSHVEFRQNLIITEEDTGGSNALSAGAIVGIVCAGVLVCGLAAWWICMRKSQGDGYRQLDE